ncbi:MAG: xanthine dehydrogenase family protein molybdopterin-binding subunit, partial [Clostridia bacterium]|nr:xanthine dehydrogenase family protein molybdopterin-binding subunit [Clostridia bacterium]
CQELKEKICTVAAEMLDCDPSLLVFEGRSVSKADGSATVSLADIATKSMCGNTVALEAVSPHSSPVSPPPFMAGMAEIELDPETGRVEVLNYQAVVDCGTVVNPNLARIQTEGGLVQAIGMTLTENIQYDDHGRLSENSFLQYKVPTRLETGRLSVEFAPSYEESGPFGAKSIGEIVINTPAPAIAHAIYRAVGRWYRELPILPETIAMDIARSAEQ